MTVTKVSLRERIYRLLCDAPQALTAAEIADRMGDDKRTVGEALRRLSHRDLVRLDHRHWLALRPDVPPRFGPRSGGPREKKPKAASMENNITRADLDWMAYWRLPRAERCKMAPPVEESA